MASSSGNLKFSVLLEAVTAAFNQNIKASAEGYHAAAESIKQDSAAANSTANILASGLKQVFQVADARSVIDALRSATAELQAMKEGAALTATQLRAVGQTGRAAISELKAELVLAKDSVKSLSDAKVGDFALEVARGKVQGLTREVASARAAYLEFQAAATNAMARTTNATEEARIKAVQSGQAVYNLLNLKSPQTLVAQIQAITSALAAFQQNSGAPAAAVARVTQAAQQQLTALTAQLNGITTASGGASLGVSRLGGELLALGGASVSLAGAAAGLKLVLDTAIQFEQVGKKLEFATGSTQKAREEFEFIRLTAKRLGIDLLASADGFAQLAAATKGTRLEGEATRNLFIGVSSAAAALGLSVDNTKSVFLALSQIASKGVVQMEELRGQLGERLPQVLQIAAKSLGITTEQLNVLVKRGLDATTALRVLGPAMTEAFSQEAAKNAGTLQGRVNLLHNAFKELLNDLAVGGLSAGFRTVFDDLQKAVEGLRNGVKGVDTGELAAFESLLLSIYTTGKNTFNTLFSAIADIGHIIETMLIQVRGVIGAFTGFKTGADNVSFLAHTMQGLSIIVGTIADGIYAIRIAFTALTGATEKYTSTIALLFSNLTFGEVSKDFKELSKTLDAAAKESFAKAEGLVTGFKSATGQAIENAAQIVNTTAATSNAAVAVVTGNIAKIGVSATVASQTMVNAAGVMTKELAFVGAEALASATILKDLGVQGAGALAATGVAADSAKKEITVFAQAGGVAVLDFTKQASGAKKSMEDLAKSLGINLPPAAVTLKDMGQSLAAVAVVSKDVADALVEKLPKAVKELNALELTRFKEEFVSGLLKAGAASGLVTSSMNTLDAAITNTLGGNFSAALEKVSLGFQRSQEGLKNLERDFNRLKDTGVNSSVLLKEALAGMLKQASNPVELEYLIARWKELGAAGLVTGRAMSEGLVAASNKLDQIRPGINSTAEAFKEFGFKSREEARLISERYLEAYRVLKESGVATASELREAFTKSTDAQLAAVGNLASNAIEAFRLLGVKTRTELNELALAAQRAFYLIEASGQASTETLRKAFTLYAEAAIRANNGVVSSFLEAKAAALGLSLTVTDTGSFSVDALGKTKFKADETASAVSNIGTAATEAGNAQVDAANKSVEALDRQTAAARKASAASTSAATSARGGSSAGDSSSGAGAFGGDVAGIGRGRGGSDGFAGDPLPSDLYNAVKAMGGSDKLALQMQTQVKRFYSEVYLGEGLVRFFSWDKFDAFVFNEVTRERTQGVNGGGGGGSPSSGSSTGSPVSGGGGQGTYQPPTVPGYAPSPPIKLPPGVTYPPGTPGYTPPPLATLPPGYQPPPGFPPDYTPPGYRPKPPAILPPGYSAPKSQLTGTYGVLSENPANSGKTINVVFTGTSGKKVSAVIAEADESSFLRMLEAAKNLA